LNLYYNANYVKYQGKGSQEKTEDFWPKQKTGFSWRGNNQKKSIFTNRNMKERTFKKNFVSGKYVCDKKGRPLKKKRINFYPFGLKHNGYNNVTSSNGNSTAQKFMYNGKEFNDELGLNLYDYGARMYDPSLGRWFVNDKLADDVMQVDKSPYAYSWNSPISLKDPDGNCPWCIGAIVGLVTEVVTQVTVNVISGNDAFDLDYADIAASTVAGAVTAGVSSGAKIAGAAARIAKASSKAGKVGKVLLKNSDEIVKASVDVKKDGVKTIGNGKSLKSAATELVTAKATGAVKSGLIGNGTDKSLKAAKKYAKKATTGSAKKELAKKAVDGAVNYKTAEDAVVGTVIAVTKEGAKEAKKLKDKI
jgi:RHS repeat-associated protein